MDGRSLTTAGSMRLVASTPEAPWLPPGSTAAVYSGTAARAPEPAIIVRLLVAPDDRFFCVRTEKGLDLPTLFLGRGGDRISAAEGLRHLAEEVLGSSHVCATCAGWVHNLVRHPDEDYPHPTPDAYVPVFRVADQRPVVEGEWVSLEQARPTLGTRHWWPIVEAHLSPPVAG